MLYFSKIIQYLLIDRKQTKKQIADKIGVKPSSLSRAINNENNDYHLSTLCSVFQALDCTLQINVIDNNTNDILYTIQDKTE